MKRLLHTPEGVRDIYGRECEKKLKLQHKLHEVLKQYGYRDIETPTFEFFEVFNKTMDSIASRELFKFFDRDGNTLVLRPDITPSIARAITKYFSDAKQEVRLCYEGNTFLNNLSYQGRLKESTQIGAEHIGSDAPQADAEAIVMVADCLKASGLTDFQISIGQVEYFKSIIRNIEMSEETEFELKDFISNRNIFGVESIIEKLNIDGPTRDALLKLPELYGHSVQVLDEALLYAPNEDAKNAVIRLQEVYRLLEYYDIQSYISFDLSMLSRYNYYTGIFFRGYTYGSGDAVVKGGRYDKLLTLFGKESPSIGFAVVVDSLLTALNHQKIDTLEKDELITITYNQEMEERVIRLASRMRREGQYVVLCYQNDSTDGLTDIRELCEKYGV